jgi:phosphatidylinositol kinase/protein kinase (PI-3  family)
MQKLEMYLQTIPTKTTTTRPISALREAMWACASTSERWLRFQVTFTESLAVMSMVGHVIGLGDRHLDNIMLDCATGTVVHIDFGMALESARLRGANRETVAFRATPLLSVACGPMGFNGAFRKVCERMHSAVCAKRESVMTVLELFREDPVNPGSGGVRALSRTVSQKHESVVQGEDSVKRMSDKLVEVSVATLIAEATNPYNLAQMYSGWDPWW